LDKGGKILQDESETAPEDRLSQCDTARGDGDEVGERRALSEEEIDERLSSLSQGDWLKLVGYGRSLTRGPDGEDLVQAACVRILEGGRSWPVNMKTVPFIFGVMRSVLDQWVSKGSLKTVSVDGLSEGQVRIVGNAAATTITAERELLAKRELKEIEGHFSEDEHATWVLTGIEDGLPAKEVQELSGMSSHEFEAARKRVGRQLRQYKKDGTFK
jgi:DNA-directed RNA polymerase specialized sigma24 family protein